MDKITILITGIGAAGVGEQILKSLKKSKLNLRIIGTDITDKCFNKLQVDEFIIVPPVAQTDVYEERLNSIIRDYNVKAIFPGSEQELKYFIFNRSKYEDLFISINSNELIELCLNKFSTYKKLESLGVRTPRYEKIDREEDCKKIDYFPVVLKPNTNAGGSSHVYVAFDQEELFMFAKYMLKNKIDIIAQEYIGGAGEEYTIGVSSDSKGQIKGSIILKRILKNGLSVSKRMNNSVTISSGISQGEFIHNENIKRQVENIAKKLNSKGPINIQGRLVGEELLIFEINPRLSGTTYLRTLVGYNEPENMLQEYIYKNKCEYRYEDKIVLRSIVEKVIN